MFEIISRADAKARGRKHFFDGLPCPTRGHLAPRNVRGGACTECQKESRRARRKNPEYRAKETEYNRLNKQKQRQDPAFVQKEREADRRYYPKRRDTPEKAERENARARDWHRKMYDLKEYRDAENERRSQYIKDNPEKNRAKQARRRAAKLQATPPWLTKEHNRQIEAFYADAHRLTGETGELWHVDHIVPLRGKDVCGLHVPWNLQVIPAIDNMRKHNKLLEAA